MYSWFLAIFTSSWARYQTWASLGRCLRSFNFTWKFLRSHVHLHISFTHLLSIVRYPSGNSSCKIGYHIGWQLPNILSDLVQALLSDVLWIDRLLPGHNVLFGKWCNSNTAKSPPHGVFIYLNFFHVNDVTKNFHDVARYRKNYPYLQILDFEAQMEKMGGCGMRCNLLSYFSCFFRYSRSMYHINCWDPVIFNNPVSSGASVMVKIGCGKENIFTTSL